MLFGSGLILAVLLSSMASQRQNGAPSDPWTGSGARRAIARAAPLPAVDLTLRLPHEQFDLKSLIPKKPPVEVKSMKVVGASGIAIYFPGSADVAAGVGLTAFKVAPGKRATQAVFGLRFRF
jgi:hypothetical protein